MKTPAIPINLSPELRRWLRDFSTSLDHELRPYVRNDVAVGSILLVSPNGSVYSVAVADDGTLNTTAVFTA